MERDSTQGLSPHQLARLLALGAKAPAPRDASPDHRTPAQVLDGMLGHRLTLDEVGPESLPAVLGRPCEELLFDLGRTLGEVLLDPGAEAAAVGLLKDYGKALARRREPGASHAAATALYYAAIAAALAARGEKITQHSYGKLEGAFAKLAAKPWMPPALKALFDRAGALCQERQG
jgi:hypothetical protein